jgi:transcriptional regulator with XRE-family HTH domain
MARPRILDSPVREKLSSFLQSYLSRNGESQDDLAKKIEVTRPSLTLYANGKRTPSGETLKRMRKFFGRDFPALEPEERPDVQAFQGEFPFDNEIRIESRDCIVSATLQRKPPAGFEITLHIKRVG